MKPAQRRYFRVPARLESRVVLRDHAPIDASVSDVSGNGLAMVVKTETVTESIAVRRWLSDGALVHVEVALGAKPVVLQGRIAWTRPVEGARETMAGVRFEDVDGPSERVLREWLLRGLSAIQGAAQHVLSDRWDDAAECLEDVGIDDAGKQMVSAVLRYAATGRATA